MSALTHVNCPINIYHIVLGYAYLATEELQKMFHWYIQVYDFVDENTYISIFRISLVKQSTFIQIES